MKSWLTDLFGLLYPNMCIGCMENSLPDRNGYLCLQCVSEMPFTDQADHPLDNAMHERLYGRFPVHWAISVFYFSEEGPVQKMMHEFKYKGERFIGIRLGKMLGERLQPWLSSEKPDLVIPVPIHKTRLIQRGFNQSEIISAALAEQVSIKHRPNVLMKLYHTQSQTRMSKSERIDNISHSFAIETSSLPLIQKKHILLVDDTITTGSTLEACARLLLKNGAAKISVACAAMAI